MRRNVLQVCQVSLVLTGLAAVYMTYSGRLETYLEILYPVPVHAPALKYPPPLRASFEVIQDFYEWSNPGACSSTAMWGGVLVGEPYAKGRTIIDGNKTICMDDKVKPTPGNCTIYSFGINEWSFDTAAATYGCDVFAFDPSMKTGDHVRGPNNKIHFFQMGLSHKDYVFLEKKYKTFASILEMLGHTDRVIDFLKVDIEGPEKDCVLEMIKSGSLQNVRQFFVEIHNFAEDLPVIRDYYGTFWLLEEQGFVRFFSAPNLLTHKKWSLKPDFEYYKCRELGWLNSKFL